MNFPMKFLTLKPNIHICKNIICNHALNNINKIIAIKSRNVHFRCSAENPIDHTTDHEGMFYSMPSNVQQQLFSHGGFTRPFQATIKSFNECCIMIRQPALEIINYMKCANYSIPVIKYLIYGRMGVGKTLVLAHLIHYASSTDWIIVHVPWAPFWTRMFKEVTSSQSRTGRMDQPHEASVWLHQFKAQNSVLLNKLQVKTSHTYTWSKREVTEEGSSLMSVVDHGLNRPKHASDCVAVILKELKLHASAGRLKAFVAVDGMNTFFSTTTAKREDKSPVAADELTLVHAFRKLIKADWNNGVIVGVIDKIAVKDTQRKSHFPLYLLGKEGFEHLDPFVPVLVDNYSEKEINSCLDYYCDRLWIQNEKGRTEEGRKELMYLSGFNPEKLIQITGAW